MILLSENEIIEYNYEIVKMIVFDYMCRAQVPVNFKQIDAHAHQQKGSSARYSCCVCNRLSL